MSKARISLKNIVKRIQQVVDDSVSPKNIRPIALNLIDIIVKRARLGYGVRENFGRKEKFPALSKQYIEARKTFKRLSATTSPKKSNITRTGDLLESIGIRSERAGNISIAPLGQRSDGISNAAVRGYLEENKRPFLYVSELEFQQIVRMYRKTFGDLLDKKGLLR